jgi:hypothetical protein
MEESGDEATEPDRHRERREARPPDTSGRWPALMPPPQITQCVGITAPSDSTTWSSVILATEVPRRISTPWPSRTFDAYRWAWARTGR